MQLGQFDISPAWANPDAFLPVVQWVPLYRAIKRQETQTFHFSPSGTWGRGVYLAYEQGPFSSAHYGSAGFWAELQLGRVFDATIPRNLRAFLDFAGRQGLSVPWFPPEELSVDANNFREALDPQPDTIVFHPDQFNPHTKDRDIWFLVWDPAFTPTTTDPQTPRIQSFKPLLGIAARFAPTGNPPNHFVLNGGTFSVDMHRDRIIIGP